MAKDKDLQILHCHIEHLCSRHAQHLKHAVGGFLVRAARQGQRIGHHVGVEADGQHPAAAAFFVGALELCVLRVA